MSAPDSSVPLLVNHVCGRHLLVNPPQGVSLEGPDGAADPGTGMRMTAVQNQAMGCWGEQPAAMMASEI
jgi:hypothetical protein